MSQHVNTDNKYVPTNWNKFRQTFLEFIKDVNNYTEFENLIKTLDDTKNKLKGDIYEFFCKIIYENLVKDVKHFYLYSDIPDDLKQKHGLPLNDKGIDALVIMKDDTTNTIQVKFRSDISNIIQYGDMATFIASTYGPHIKGFTKGIIFTNCYDVCEELKNDGFIKFTRDSIVSLTNDKTFWDETRKMLTSVNNKSVKLIKPYVKHKHQKNVFKLCHNHFYIKNENKGIIYSPPGTGKTLMCFWISNLIDDNKTNNQNRNILISVPSLHLLNDTFLVWEKEYIAHGFDFNFLLIGSDIDMKTFDGNIKEKVTTDQQTVNDFIKNLNKNKTNFVITTYQSSELIINACTSNKFKFDFFVGDEAHKTTGEEKKEFGLLVGADVSHKKLFVTATTKVFKQKNNILTANIETYSMDNVHQYGSVIHTLSLRQAIEIEKLLCDYKIITPVVKESEMEEFIKNQKYVNVDNDLYTSRELMIAYMIKKCFDGGQIRHLLVYCNKNKNALRMNNCLKKVFEQDNKYKEISIKYMNGETKMTDRKKVINEFEKSEFAIISSAKILNEGIDIKICDSVCFAENRSSTVDIIQCIGRSLRLCCDKKPNKIAHVIIPVILPDDVDLFESDNSEYYKVKSILKALATTDEQVAERFTIEDSLGKYRAGKESSENNKDINDKELVMNVDSKTMDINKLITDLTIRLFDKFGDEDSVVRKMILDENRNRLQNNQDLIDTKKKCEKFLKDNNVALESTPKNWIRFCAGYQYFDVLKKKYYYDLKEFKNMCHVLELSSIEKYKQEHNLDPKLPSYEYINSGFYNDLDDKFNINLMLPADVNNEFCEI